MKPSTWLAGLALGLALIGGGFILGQAIRANALNVAALKALEPAARSSSVGETAWEKGWASLCSEPETATVTKTGNAFMALALLDSGDYQGAYQILSGLPAGDLPNGPAYLAALQMDWLAAAQLYQAEPTGRSQRWWGTIFYQAAQQLMFQGEPEAAAELYRRADAAYGQQGPYLSLALADCLVQAGRQAEAFDVTRRALVVLPPAEALSHREQFAALRLAGLQQWQAQDPDNARVNQWLVFYQEAETAGETETRPLAAAPDPAVDLVQELENGQMLVGFDYRPEDIETGPFMDVVFYLQEGTGEDATYWQVNQTVLNQAPNGSFAWDAAPDGVRPFGWHEYIYTPDPKAIVTDSNLFPNAWLCLDANHVGDSFGLQSLKTSLDASDLYVQGGQLFAIGPSSLSLGRAWYGPSDPNNYSYVGGRPQPDQVLPMVGTWERVSGSDSVAVWLLSHKNSNGCFSTLFLFQLPPLGRGSS
ncbi:MAG: tetratricopeptide repeat protein [Ardenticatenaceae bacterium]|nr:tetratricopeptide repeat protein [Ardenticatenaceae bacterium]